MTAVPKAPTTAEVMNLASRTTPLSQFQKNEEIRVGSDIFHRNAARKGLDPHGESGPLELRGRFLPYRLVTELANPFQEIDSGVVIRLLLGARMECSALSESALTGWPMGQYPILSVTQERLPSSNFPPASTAPLPAGFRHK